MALKEDRPHGWPVKSRLLCLLQQQQTQTDFRKFFEGIFLLCDVDRRRGCVAGNGGNLFTAVDIAVIISSHTLAAAPRVPSPVTVIYRRNDSPRIGLALTLTLNLN